MTVWFFFSLPEHCGVSYCVGSSTQDIPCQGEYHHDCVRSDCSKPGGETSKITLSLIMTIVAMYTW